MPVKKYFSYIRVSTQRQGQNGTSLAEQQASIERFAQTWNLPIVKKFEERETAAKLGRPVFLDMLKQLKGGHAAGVIIHKIDRSARNLKDWADLGTLIDNGLEVHFASESLDLSSRGGRLSADIQAVVASDYIRNLSEETKKGIYGRLKQGLYPFRAMVGYLDSGSGKPKAIDPISAPLVRRAFELYASGDWGLIELTAEMNRAGLRTRSGKELSRTGLAWILHNPFYIGMIKMKRTGVLYSGIHRPLVSRETFDRVQNVFAGKNIKKSATHYFVFRRLVSCQNCKRYLTPEIQKGNTYYRCRNRNCLRHCLREELLQSALIEQLKKIVFSTDEMVTLRNILRKETMNLEQQFSKFREGAVSNERHLKDRNSKLADAYMKGIFDDATYIQKKNELIKEENALKQAMASTTHNKLDLESQFVELCELANSAYSSYKKGIPNEQRELVNSLVANITSDGKSVSIKLKTPYEHIARRTTVQYGCLYRSTGRTFSKLANQLISYFVKSRESSIPEG